MMNDHGGGETTREEPPRLLQWCPRGRVNPSRNDSFRSVFHRSCSEETRSESGGTDATMKENKNECVEYVSFEELKECKRRNIRSSKHPCEKSSTPSTTAQEVGWVSCPATDLNESFRKPRQKSYITKYMESLILGPRHF